MVEQRADAHRCRSRRTPPVFAATTGAPRGSNRGVGKNGFVPSWPRHGAKSDRLNPLFIELAPGSGDRRWFLVARRSAGAGTSGGLVTRTFPPRLEMAGRICGP
jgi:hypothetical protein